MLQLAMYYYTPLTALVLERARKKPRVASINSMSVLSLRCSSIILTSMFTSEWCLSVGSHDTPPGSEDRQLTTSLRR